MTPTLVPEYARRKAVCAERGHQLVQPKPEQVQRVVCGYCGASFPMEKPTWNHLNIA